MSQNYAAFPFNIYQNKEDIFIDKLKVTLIRSVIGRPQNQRDIVKGLGLGRVNSSVVVPDNAAMRGAIRKINHLVDVELAK